MRGQFPVVALLSACGLALTSACSSPSHAHPDGGAATEALGDLEPLRCLVSPPTIFHPPDILRDTWMVRGPDGPRLVGTTADRSLYWADRARTGMMTDESLISPEGPAGQRVLAWTGTNYLSVGDGEVQRRNGSLTDAVRVHTGLPASGCAPSLTEMSGRAMLLWRRPPRGGSCDQGMGTPWIQILDASGSPTGDARALAAADRDLRVTAVRARWDFGRLVVEARDVDLGATRYWVLDPGGTELTRGSSGRVACPRSGCLRVRAVHEAAGTNVDGSSQVIRLDPLDGSPGFSTNAPAASISALAVSGDLVLVLHPEAGLGTGCHGTVLDVARHAVLASFSDEGLTCDDGRVVPTPTGFRVVTVDTARDMPTVATRDIHCTN